MSAADDEAKLAAPTVGAGPRLSSTTRNLTLVNLAFTAAALLTSPLQARALGPDGRGDLAAVTVVLGAFGLLGGLGLGAYAVRESARGRPVRTLVGSLGPRMLALGLLYALAAPFVARFIADGRDTVYILILVGLLLSPLLIPSGITTGIVWGQQRWTVFSIQRLVLPLGSAIVYVALFVLDELTVATAGATFIVLSVAGVVPGYVVLRRAGRPQRERTVASEGGRYGRNVWLSSLAGQANARLDQLLMARLVPSSELGLYVVAFNFSLLQNSFTTAVSNALLPRVAADDSAVVARALRVVIALTTLLSVTLFVSAPFLLPLAFGEDFSAAVTMSQILLAAAMPFGVVQVLTAVVNGIGEPQIGARGQLISLAITIPGLALLIKPYGGEGAAVTSLVAYNVTALYLATKVRRILGIGLRELVLFRRSDIEAIRALPGVGRILGRR